MSAATAVKRKMTTVGTHNGTFHCDEALGCWLLKHTKAFADATVVRTRDPAVLATLDVVIDVGGVYDPSMNRYDHHQRDFSHDFGHGHKTKLSSAGLVYKHFGREVIASLLHLSPDHADLDAIYLEVYKNFIEAVDAIDNGINPWDSTGPPKYRSNTHLAARVGRLNPEWNEPATDEEVDERFAKAMLLAGSEFEESVRYISKCWLPARSIVLETVLKRKAVHHSGQIIKLEQFCPWKEHLYQIEDELGISGEILFCVYQDDRDHTWRIQAVSEGPGSFVNRKSLREEWRGLRDEQLSDAAGVPGCVFVHASGFIGGHRTYEGAYQLAVKSLC